MAGTNPPDTGLPGNTVKLAVPQNPRGVLFSPAACFCQGENGTLRQIDTVTGHGRIQGGAEFLNKTRIPATFFFTAHAVIHRDRGKRETVLRSKCMKHDEEKERIGAA
ncbi:MAG: hypothetical protein BWY20_02140 [Spirochaetes bacterium ADurb.Bin215]|nr:MAG: hypothetical protein BWY20_02140 [Spirochaetes bacterium ADurb.Bin215]